MGATCHLVASSEIFLVRRNIMPPEGTNMYSSSASYTHKYIFTYLFFTLFGLAFGLIIICFSFFLGPPVCIMSINHKKNDTENTDTPYEKYLCVVPSNT